MKSKIFLSLFAIMAFSAAIFAKDVLRSEAEKVAVNLFFEKSHTFGKGLNYHDINIIDSYKVENAYYVINFEDGWVVVSAEDVSVPIIAYNVEGKFPSMENQNYNFKSWMQHYIDQANYIKENNIVATEDVELMWNKYYTNNPESLLDNTRDRDIIEPLLSALWNQDDPYNLLCPEDEDGPGGNVYVGCVATAMSMIMHYWRYPETGTGSYSYYQYPYGVISADFSAATYEWDAMQDQIAYNNPWEIAEIGFHAAVSVQMNFSPDGSGSYSWDVPSALTDHFGYSSSAQYIEKSNYSTSAWEGFLQSEINNGHPLYYSGYSSDGGHAFVCDAYEGSNYYHFNFGWSGSGNGFYSLQDVGGFSGGQGIVRNIVPGDVNYPYIAEGETVLSYPSGSFTDGSGPLEDYPSGVSASWLISPQTEIDSIDNISLSFIEFSTNANDYLRIYEGNNADGNMLAEYSGSTIPSQISYDGNELYITFSSTGSNSGFKAEYTSSSPTWCSGAQNFTEQTGSFSDGSGDFHYSNGATCVFTITNPEAVNITLEFTSFATEEGKDKVIIFNGSNQIIAELSGQEIPDPIVEETNAMYITWSTNNTVRDIGWTAEYYIDGVGVKENIGDYKNLSLYPNPSTGMFNLSFDIEKAGPLEIKIMNMNGQTVKEEKINEYSGNFNQSIDLSDQAKGIYMLSITSEQGKIDKKIVLK